MLRSMEEKDLLGCCIGVRARGLGVLGAGEPSRRHSGEGCREVSEADSMIEQSVMSLCLKSGGLEEVLLLLRGRLGVEV